MSDFKYHRVSSRFWTDEKVMRWDDDTRMLALYLLTCPHRTTEGLFRLPKQYMVADLGWDLQRLAKPFAQLLADGFLLYDETVSVALLPHALKYQAPQNTNQAIAAARAVAELPKTPLLIEFQRLAERFSKRLAQQLRELLGEPPAPSPAPSPERENARACASTIPNPDSSTLNSSVGQSSDFGYDELPDPHDGMTVRDISERYQRVIGIMGPGIFAQLTEWHEQHGMSCGVLAEAIDRTAEARDEGRISGNLDRYLVGVIRGMHNDGTKTMAELRSKARSRADPHGNADYTPPTVSHHRRMADLDEQIRLAQQEQRVASHG